MKLLPPRYIVLHIKGDNNGSTVTTVAMDADVTLIFFADAVRIRRGQEGGTVVERRTKDEGAAASESWASKY